MELPDRHSHNRRLVRIPALLHRPALTTARRAAFLQKTLPLYAAIFAYIFLKEKITKKMSYALAAMLVGSGVVYFAQMSLGPALVESLARRHPDDDSNDIVGRRGRDSQEGDDARRVQHSCHICKDVLRRDHTLRRCIAAGKFGLLLALSVAQWTNIMISTILLFAYVLFWYWSIKYINVTKATTMLLTASVIAVGFATVLFPEEPLPILQIVGSAIILIGAYFVGREKSESRKKA